MSSKSYNFWDYFHPLEKEIRLCDEMVKETDEEKQKELLGRINSMRGIFTDEDGEQYVSESVFVKYIMESFSMLSISGTVAFYNYNKHMYEYIGENEYLSFFKYLLDEVNTRLWCTKLEAKYRARFKRDIQPRLREWSIPCGWVSFENGCLNVEDGKFYSGDHPGIHNFNNTGYCYDKEAIAPKFIDFIYDVFGGDQSLIDVVQEVLGYTLMYGANPLQIITIFDGSGRNGKGILSNILMQVHGEANCSATSVSQLSSQFGVAQMYDKVLNISNENNENVVSDTSILKTCSGNDLVMVERKYCDAIPVHVYTKLFISTNSISFRDSSKGFEERLIPIPFKYTYVDHPKGPNQKQRDNLLEQKLAMELPGIFNWMYEGLVRLRNNHYHITESEEIKRQRQKIVSISNPVQLFIKENILFEPCAKVRKPEVYKRYKEWVVSQGVNTGIYQSAQRFYEKFNAILIERSVSPECKKIQGYDYYSHITLK